MRYEGDIYRPPSEAYSLLLQVTVGCSHNKCSFCGMFKDKRFHVRQMSEIIEDLEGAARSYGRVRRIFLCDGDALCLSNNKLVKILSEINRLFPEIERVGIYGSAKDILRKSDDELKELKRNGLGIIYLGAESGSDEVLIEINKGTDREDMIKAVRKAENAGIPVSVTFISGIAGRKNWREHAIQTGKMIAKMNASYVSLLTLMLDPKTPLYKDIQEGKFELLTGEEVLAETYLMLENAKPTKTCVFRSNHASNYISLRGNLPEDRDRMLGELEHAMKNTELLKDERFRML